ncbi:MAG: alkaline phosphatase [Dehalococcoidia bacterium]|nr:alkaline phosphatase [Dehalococcoidia bacterium]
MTEARADSRPAPGAERRRYFAVVIAALALWTLLPGKGDSAAPPAMAEPAAARPAVLIGAGDIADCGVDEDEETAQILDRQPGTVFTVGDNVYESGTVEEFAECYHPTWGRHKHRTMPAVGNHEYLTDGARPYFEYFGAAAGNPWKGYYSYNRGGWHIVVLNSNCSEVGGCDWGSRQVNWLRRDLINNPRPCTIAYWHSPRFTSGERGNRADMIPFWQVLYRHRVDVVLNGHDHFYERFRPQTPWGQLARFRGITQFTVGTGGKGLSEIPNVASNSVVREDETHGVLKLSLLNGAFRWRFIPIDGQSFADSGRTACR